MTSHGAVPRTPDEWQTYALNLLRIRYQFDFHHVPDKSGDYGIEAFTDDGGVYQCYAPEAGISMQEQYNRQRDKVTEDLTKLRKYEAKLVAMLGANFIRRWMLMVPSMQSKELLTHCTTKTVEYRKFGLKCLHEDFQVSVSTAEDFPAERQRLVGLALSTVDLEPEAMRTEDVSTHLSGQLVERLTTKLGRLPIWDTPQDMLDYRNDLLLQHIEAENFLAKLSELYPATRVDLDRLKARTARTLSLEGRVSDEEPHRRLAVTVERFQDRVASELPALRNHANLIAWSSATGWLMHCALDFPERG